MEIEPLEPGALPDLMPVRRRRPIRLALVLAGVTVVAGIGMAISGDGDLPPTVETASRPKEPEPPSIAPAIPVDPTTTTEVTLGTTSSAASASTTTTRPAAPTPTTARPPTTTATRPSSGPTRGVVLTADQPGVWVADLAAGSPRRVADAGPFDVAGDVILTAKGREVFATPLAGGDTVLRYETPSQGDPGREKVEWIDAGVDGSAVVGIFAPISGGSGGNFFLRDPSGREVATEYISTTFAWSVDGTKVAVTSFAYPPAPTIGTPPTGSWSLPRQTLLVLDSEGTVLHGPTDADEVYGLSELRWAGDGGSVVFRGASGGPLYRWDLAGGGFSVLPPKAQSVDIGPDGRILTTRSFPQNDMAVDFLDPVTGALKPFIARGDRPSWSPDGRSVLVAAIPPPHYGNTPYPLTIFDTAGSARFTITIPDRLAFGQGDEGYRSQYPQGPQWSVSSRYVVFAVYPR